MSIEIKRLMIGAYVIYRPTQEISRVVSLNENDEFPIGLMKADGQFYHCRSIGVGPIDITREIFEMFAGQEDGFEGFQFAYHSNFENGSGIKNYNNGLQFSYLHTFQMYLSALFGESLEIDYLK